MKAAVVRNYGAPQVGEFEEPHARDGQEVIDMLMAGLNPVDIILASGNIPAIALPLPGVVGMEGVGMMDCKRVYFSGSVSPFGSVPCVRGELRTRARSIYVPHPIALAVVLLFSLFGAK
jgi:hypothetical protein